MESDEHLCKIYISETNEIKTLRRKDLGPCKEDFLPSTLTLIDEHSSQSKSDLLHHLDGHEAEVIKQELIYRMITVPLESLGKARKSTAIPQSFKEAIEYGTWIEEINREYAALKRRNTWKHVKLEKDMLLLP